jgi:phosphohistidine phosphatase
MNIVILRHGEAQAYAASDAQRQLTDYGVEQAIKAGYCLRDIAFTPDLVWASPYIRAQQTCENVLAPFNTIKSLSNQLLVPDANPQAVIDEISQQSCQNLLLVSHQPLVGHLIRLLADNGIQRTQPMATASMAFLSGETPFAGCFKLQFYRHAPNFEPAL